MLSAPPTVFRALLPLALLGLLAGAALADSAPRPRLVRVTFDAAHRPEMLLGGGFDVLEMEEGGSALVFEWPGDEARLAAIGARPVVVDPDPTATYQKRAAAELALRPAPRAARVLSAVRADGALHAESLPPFGSGSWLGYWTPDEIKMELDSLVADDPFGVVADKVDTVGYSYLNAPIWGLRIGHTTSGGSMNPVVFLNALTHAREPEGMQALLYFVHHLLAGYGSDPFATYLLDHRSITLVPCVNPDGYAYNAPGGGLWRKNRDGNGVDLNRNFGFMWGIDNVGSSPTSTSDIYRGPSPFSEPETRAQRDLVIALHPITGLSLHTYSDLFLHAWGYTTTKTVDEAAFDEWDNLGTRWTRHPTGGSNVTLYGTNGDFNDWAYGDTISKPRAFTWTPEIGVTGDGFWPAPSRIVPIAQEMLNTFYSTTAIAGPYVQLVNHVVPEGLLVAGGIVPISLDVRNHGLAATGTGLTATLVSLDPAVTVLTGPLHYPTLPSRSSASPVGGGTVMIAASDTTTPGRMVRLRCDFATPDGFYSRDTLDLIVGSPTVLLREDGNLASTKWFNTGTAIVPTGGPTHPGPYAAMNSNDRLVMKGSLDLSHGTHAWALFDGMWAIHPVYNAGFEPTDFYAVVEASLDSVTWTALSGTQAVRPSDPAVTIVPGFTGTQVGWTQVWLDLSKFAGPTSNKVRFRLRAATTSGATGEFDLDTLRVLLYDPATQPIPLAVGDAPGGGALALAPAQPNPARGITRLEYVVPRREQVTLEIFDIAGRRVATLANGEQEPGRHAQDWRLVDDAGRAVGPGVYLARLRDAATQSVRRIAIVR